MEGEWPRLRQTAMKSRVVLLGGVIAAGKTTLAADLVACHGFTKVSTRSALEQRAASKGLAPSRNILQDMGDELDAETNGVWVLDQIELASLQEPFPARLLLDSVRRDFQIKRAKARWPNQVFYVHLVVPLDVARSRYEGRNAKSDVTVPFEQAKASATEQHADTLSGLADLVLDTSSNSSKAAAASVAMLLASASTRGG